MRHTGMGLGITGLAAILLAGCDAADGVEVQPLPPLERPSHEARAGVPAIEGTWRFAGWEVGSEDIALQLGSPLAPGDLELRTQRIDSLAGYLVRGEASIPLVGEVRRDGILSLASLPGETAGRFAAGRLVRDTLWIELSTLPAGELSPPTVRWAFVRGMVGQAFFRLPSGELLRDTVVAPPPELETARVVPVPVPAPAEAEEVQEETAPAALPTPAAARREPGETQPAPAASPDSPRTPAQTQRPPQPQRPDTTRRLPPPGPRIDIPPRMR